MLAAGTAPTAAAAAVIMLAVVLAVVVVVAAVAAATAVPEAPLLASLALACTPTQRAGPRFPAQLYSSAAQVAASAQVKHPAYLHSHHHHRHRVRLLKRLPKLAGIVVLCL